MKKSIKKSLALVLALAVLTAIALTGCGNSKSSKIQIAVPNDTTNEARALLLLQENGVIKLRDGAGITATKNDIVENRNQLKLRYKRRSQPRIGFTSYRGLLLGLRQYSRN